MEPPEPVAGRPPVPRSPHEEHRRRIIPARPGAGDRVVAEPEAYRTDILPGFELPSAPPMAAADLRDRQD